MENILQVWSRFTYKHKQLKLRKDFSKINYPRITPYPHIDHNYYLKIWWNTSQKKKNS